MRCKWVLWEPDGRPWCEHGRAHKAGPAWRCPLKDKENARRYQQSERGREVKRRINASEAQKSFKAVYELTRVRVR